MSRRRLRWGSGIAPHLLCIIALIAILALASPSFAQYKYWFQFGSAGTGNGQFNRPTGIAVDSQSNVFVVDTPANSVQKFDKNGLFIKKFGTAGSGNGQFLFPRGIAIDSKGNVFVADDGNSRVEKFDKDGNYLAKFGSNGSGAGQFNGIASICIDGADNVYTAEFSNNRIQKFNKDGVFQLQFGATGSANGQFLTPLGIAVDSSGNIYVADSGNNRIQKFDATGQFLSKFGTSGGGNGQLNNIDGLTLDLQGNLYVVDSWNSRVQVFTTSGTYVGKLGTYGTGEGQFVNPSGVSVDPNGVVYVSEPDNKRVQVFAQNIIPVISGTNSPLYIGGSGALTLTGDKFVNRTVASVGNVLVPITSLSRTKMTVTVPNNLIAQQGSFLVQLATGTETSNVSRVSVVGYPTPVVTSISPKQVPAGSDKITFTVNGSNFVTGKTIVKFDGTPLTPTTVTSTKLALTLPPDLLATAGKFSVVVSTPRPGGGNSRTLTFTVNNPTPVLTDISPDTIVLGAVTVPNVILTGTGFVESSRVYFDGQLATTIFRSGTKLEASVPSFLLNAMGDHEVTVFTPGPGGGTSASQTYSVVNPSPTLDTLSLDTTTETTSTVTITLKGTGFMVGGNGSIVYFGTEPLTISSVSTTEISGFVPAKVASAPGIYDVYVSNPDPGGGDSNALPFEVTMGTAAVLLSTTPPAVTQSGTNLSVVVTLLNATIFDARSVRITSAKLNTTSSKTISPVGAVTIKKQVGGQPGKLRVVLTFPTSAAVSGTKPTLTLTYTSTNAGSGTLTATTAIVP